jgi:hypothetical protein
LYPTDTSPALLSRRLLEFRKHAAIESFEQVVRERGIEVVGDPHSPPVKAHGAGFHLRHDGDETGDGDAGAGDGYFLSGGHALQEAGEMSFGLMDVDFHKATVD